MSSERKGLLSDAEEEPASSFIHQGPSTQSESSSESVLPLRVAGEASGGASSEQYQQQYYQQQYYQQQYQQQYEQQQYQQQYEQQQYHQVQGNFGIAPPPPSFAPPPYSAHPEFVGYEQQRHTAPSAPAPWQQTPAYETQPLQPQPQVIIVGANTRVPVLPAAPAAPTTIVIVNSDSNNLSSNNSTDLEKPWWDLRHWSLLRWFVTLFGIGLPLLAVGIILAAVKQTPGVPLIIIGCLLCTCGLVLLLYKYPALRECCLCVLITLRVVLECLECLGASPQTAHSHRHRHRHY